MHKPTRRKMRPDLMRQSEAARVLGCHRNTVVALYSRKVLRGKFVGGLLFVNREDVEREAATRAAEDQAA